MEEIEEEETEDDIARSSETKGRIIQFSKTLITNVWHSMNG